MGRRILVLMTALAVAIALDGLARENPRGPTDSASASEELRRLAAAEEWEALAKSASRHGERMAGKRHRDPRDFSEVAAWRALAALKLEEKRDALWHWQAALNLDSDAAALTLEPFPDAALVFGATGLPSITLVKDPKIRPAVPRATTRPYFLVPDDPRRPPPPFEVRILVGTDGVPHSPQIVGRLREDGDRAYSALEALRRWRFTPATKDGQKIEVPMSFTTMIGPPSSQGGHRKRRM